jgi:hypothetical protein
MSEESTDFDAQLRKELREHLEQYDEYGEPEPDSNEEF